MAFIGLVTFYWEGGWIVELFRVHYVFFVGLLFAGLLAYFLVGALENTRGKIEFEFLGLKFKGASGPIIMAAIKARPQGAKYNVERVHLGTKCTTSHWYKPP